MKVKLTKKFQAQLRNLKRNGKRKQYEQATMLLYELQQNDKPSKNFRSDSRLPNILKFELPDSYRIVFQKVKADNNVLLALTVGSHSNVDEYLDNHKGWIFDTNTHTIRELQIYDPEDKENTVPYSADLNKKIGNVYINEENIFKELDKKLLVAYGYKESTVDKLYSITDIDSIEFMNLLEDIENEKEDLLLAYATGNSDQKEEIIRILNKKSVIVKELSKEHIFTVNADSENFVDLRDIDDVKFAFENYNFEDWMLYLHPDQRKYAYKEYNGPVRIGGVAGSGKTVVAIHRAKYFANKILNPEIDNSSILYKTNQKVLFLTYNKSLADYIQKQLKKLCTTEEYKIINVIHIDRLTRDLLNSEQISFYSWDNQIVEDLWLSVIERFLGEINKMNCFGSIDFFDHKRTSINFIRDEVEFIFGKFLYEESDKYLKCSRRGRIIRLGEEDRDVILRIYKSYLNLLMDKMQYIPFIQQYELLRFLETDEFNYKKYKSIIVDEIQDLNEIQLRIIYKISSGKNLFLVGDNAQKIYNRGFSFKNIGINIIGRSFYLTRNYRNTKNIIEIAKSLKEKRDIGKYDEEPESARFLAKTTNISIENPLLMIFKNPDEESATITKEVKYLINTMGVNPNEIVILSRLSWIRNHIKKTLISNNIHVTDYRADGIRSNNSVKLSNLHNIKGHEFRVVFILGLFEGSIPFVHDQMLEEPEYIDMEASLLYVAMTRAKEMLYLSYSKTDQRGRDHQMSRFIEDLRANLDIIEI